MTIRQNVKRSPFAYASNSELVYVILAYREGGRDGAIDEMRRNKFYPEQYEPVLQMCKDVMDYGFAQIFGCGGLNEWLNKWLKERDASMTR